MNIEVVGGLIEQKDVGVGEQCLSQQDPKLPARRNLPHWAIVLFYRNTNAEQQFTGPCLCCIAIVLRELCLKIGCLHVIVFASLRIGINGVPLRHRRPHFLVPHHHHVEHTNLFKSKLILAQLTQANMLIFHDIAA